MRRLVIYIHGKGGSANEAEHYKPLFRENDVRGFDYRSQNPSEEQMGFLDKWMTDCDSVEVFLEKERGKVSAVIQLGDEESVYQGDDMAASSFAVNIKGGKLRFHT